jgi:hypothetical protein
MPAVPEQATLPNQQQDVGGLPSIHSPSPETMFGALGEGMQALGKSTGQLSDVYAQHALAVASLNNKAMSDVAYTGYLDQAGKMEADFQEASKNVDPSTAQQRYTDYVGQLEQLRQKYRGTLGNMMAQSTFDQDSRRMQGYMIMNGSKTIATGVSSYRREAFEGTQKTLAAQAAASSDPSQQEDIKQQAVNAVVAYGHTQGLPDEALQAASMQTTSAIDVSIIDQRMKTDPEGAMTYFQQHKAEMTPEHQGALQEQLTGALTLHGAMYAAQAGMSVAGSAVSSSTAAAAAPPSGPLNSRGLTAPMASLEAGILRDFPNTRPTSEGRTNAQSVAVNGFAGDPHTQGRAVDFHIPAGVSGPEFAAQIKAKYPQATVLYEGPNAANSTAPHVHVQLGAAGVKGANGYLPGTPGANLDAIQGNAQQIFAATDAAANTYAEKWGLDPVMVRYQAEQKAESDMNRQEYQFRQVEDASRSNLLQALTTPGANGEPPGDLQTLFRTDHSLQGDFNNLTGSDRRMVQNALRGNQNALTAPRQVEWERVQGMDSTTFLQQNPLDPNLDLTNSQRMQMVSQQKVLRQKVASQQDHDVKINSIASNRLVKAGLQDAGILDTNGQVSNPQDYQVFMGRMLQAEQDWQTQHPTHKGPIPDQEVVNMATPLIGRRGIQPPMQVFGLNVPFTGSPGERAPLIPPDRYSALHDQFYNQFGVEPTAEQIGREYELRRQRGLEK